jgi:alkaline phosphatase
MPRKIIIIALTLVALPAMYFASALNATKTPQSFPYKTDQAAYSWFSAGNEAVSRSKALFPEDKKAKNVILFLGDGMGITTITAARILAGQSNHQPGESTSLSFEKFPHLALSKTYNTNQQVPDSAGTITAILTGVKTSAGVLSVDETVKLGETAPIGDKALVTLIEQAETWGLATGIVTTARVTHATPAGAYAHTSHRDWESDADLPEHAKQAGVQDIARQLLGFSHGDGINLILAGGRNYFTPKTEGGLREDGRNLINEWKQKYSEGVYVSDNQTLSQVDWSKTNHVLGLFSGSHMSYNIDRNQGPEGEPSLSQMTEDAITYLSRFPQGYVLIIEGGRIDHGHHAGNAYRALSETVELSNAVAVAEKLTSDKDTLIIVTADHSHAVTMNGYPVLGNPILGKVVSWNEKTGEAELTLDKNGLPYTTLQYANGPGARGRVDLQQVDTSVPDYKQEALVPLESETHGGEDVAIFARGPGSSWIHGVMEQNEIYHVMKAALGR